MIVSKISRETECELVFRTMGTLLNANTPENHPVVFSSDEEFKAGMSILAVCALQYPDVKFYAFQLMSNHVHFVLGGESFMIQEFFRYYTGRLQKFFGRQLDLADFKLKLFPINDLSYLRNAIVYVNRNGFVVRNDVTPFSYPWGSSQYFFQPTAVRYARLSGKAIGNTSLRKLMHSKYCDKFNNLLMVDGFVCPLEFVDISVSESVFKDARQYFNLISRKVEAYLEVAKSIGESVFYNDNDLYLAAARQAKERYGTSELKTLKANDKLELAKCLHYDYNASAKQIQRILSVDINLLKALL